MNAKTKILRFITPVLTGALLIAACDSGNHNHEQMQVMGPPEAKETAVLAVQPPISGLDVPFESYAVSVAEGMLIETATGTTIEVPAHAFVDKDGNAIQGDVEIKFREFHNATDIIASGIPMHDPETGAYMETAGMFEMKGEQQGKEIFIKGDKEVKVSLASFNEGDHFNFYQLAEENGRWQDKGTANAQPNTRKQKRLAALDRQLPPKPVQPRKYSNAKNFVFDLDIDYSMFPELKTFKGVLWEYAGEGKNPEKNDWIFSANWSKVDLKKSSTGYFELCLFDGKKSFKTLVRPVLDDDNYEKALAEFSATKMEEYNRIKVAQEKERERLALQANLTRSFAVNGFGIYNWDVWHKPGRRRCVAKPKFDALANVEKGVNRISFFLVMGGMRSVVRYTPESLKRFSFNPLDNNTLLAILPEGKVAVFSATDFKELDLDKVVENRNLLMKMATSTVKISSLDDLDEVINIAMT